MVIPSWNVCGLVGTIEDWLEQLRIGSPGRRQCRSAGTIAGTFGYWLERLEIAMHMNTKGLGLGEDGTAFPLAMSFIGQ
jgi:hypothetical protein